MSSHPEIDFLILLLNEGYSKKAWHGPNLRGSIRGLTAREAAWRPGRSRHNIWEIVVHCAYWKYVVRRRILGEKRGNFPLKGSNWFACPVGKPTEVSWRSDIELLAEMHRLLLDAVSGLPSGALGHIPRGSRVDNRSIIAGVAMHDVYHAGQIQLVKRLMRGSKT